MYAALQKVSPLSNGYHYQNNFRKTDKYSRSYMYIMCSFSIFCSLSPGSLSVAENKGQLV